MKKIQKKAFTLVELLVVIAILAVLATVAILGYSSFTNKANQSNDATVVAELNRFTQAYIAGGGEVNTVTDIANELEKDGFKLSTIKTSYKKDYYAFDVDKQEFKVVTEKDIDDKVGNPDLFVFVASQAELEKVNYAKYSAYLQEGYVGDTITTSKGIDVGVNNGIKSINYSYTPTGENDHQEVVIRTTGGTLNIGSSSAVAKGQIYHYGTLKSSTVYTEEDCFHTYGAIGEMNLKAGKVIAEENSLVYLSTANMGVKLEEKNSGKVFIPSGTTQAEDGTGVPISVAAQINVTPVEANVTLTYLDATKQGGNIYEIGNLAALEQYRDLVNSGFNFEGITAKLTADITLKNGWKPIGEGARRPGYASDGQPWEHTGTSFSGNFDGNGHTIYNLNNIGYEPTAINITTDTKGYVYSYGLFGITTSGATISNLTLRNVDIDTSRPNIFEANGDCVGGLVGFCAGSLTVSSVGVYGRIKGKEAVGGLIGRAYNQDNVAQIQTITIQSCIVDANIECTNYHVAGLISYVSDQGTANFEHASFNISCSNNTVKGVYKAPGNDLAGLFNFSDTENAVTITVKKNTVDCSLVMSGNSEKVKWAACVNSKSESTITFGTDTDANTKGTNFSASVDGSNVTASIAEH